MRPNPTDGRRRSQLNAKQFLLTYPQSNFELDGYKEWAVSLGAVKGIVSSELHQDGALHRHALLLFADAFRTRDLRVFDYQGRHPNIIANIRSLKGAIEYVKKDGDTVTWGNWEEEKRTWQDLIVNSDNVEQFMGAVCKHYARDYVLQYDRVKSFAELHYARSEAFDYASEFTDFNVPESLQSWVTDNLGQGNRRVKSLILVSPTRFGKTEWARSLGKHHYYNGMVNFKEWFNHPELKYVVFDDFEWSSVEHFKKQWFGCQKQFTVTDKYMAKKTIKLGVPLIWLCNACPPLDDWMLGNVEVIYLENPLY